jgi:hypothetical protein
MQCATMVLTGYSELSYGIASNGPSKSLTERGSMSRVWCVVGKFNVEDDVDSFHLLVCSSSKFAIVAATLMPNNKSTYPQPQPHSYWRRAALAAWIAA